MPLRIFKRVPLIPGLRANISKSGISLWVGHRGAWFTVGPRGRRWRLRERTRTAGAAGARRPPARLRAASGVGDRGAVALKGTRSARPLLRSWHREFGPDAQHRRNRRPCAGLLEYSLGRAQSRQHCQHRRELQVLLTRLFWSEKPRAMSWGFLFDESQTFECRC